MKACAITDRQASMWSVFSMSKTNWGFFKMFTQKRRGRLWGQGQWKCGSLMEGWGGRQCWSSQPLQPLGMSCPSPAS